MIVSRLKGKLFSVRDLACAYHQLTRSSDNQKLTIFINSWRKMYITISEDFLVFAVYQTSSVDWLKTISTPLSKKKQAINYIEDTELQSQFKYDMFTIFNEYHCLLKIAALKAAPEKKTISSVKRWSLWGMLFSPMDYNWSLNETKT